MPEDGHTLQRIPLRGLPGNPRGDLDLLYVSPMSPDRAVAIEVKRVKIDAASIRSASPKKLQEYEKGVRQANLLASIGFHLVYLYVFVVIDSREQNHGQISYAGAPNILRSKIEQRLTLEALNPNVGMMHWELIQPMDFPPLTVGASGGKLQRRAMSRNQPAEVSDWVAKILSEHVVR